MVSQKPPDIKPLQSQINPVNVILLCFSGVIIFVIGITIGVLNSNKLLTMIIPEKCDLIAKVVINPGNINISEKNKPVELSALAYDNNNNPIFKGVSYEWGISSNNTVGTINQKNDLATFSPINVGRGDLFVKADSKCLKNPVIGSVGINIHTDQVAGVSTSSGVSSEEK